MDILSQAGGMSLDRLPRMFAIYRLSVSAKAPLERSTICHDSWPQLQFIGELYWQAPQATSAHEGKLEAGGAGAGSGATYTGSGA